ncbi:hypothetical protein B0O99DRAFT_588095 [Bisporella sp. PMI_857]|nr:hypothetical protein B0O99DRAFT_588095 [Bisporella sp. PMI_857]
MQLLKTAGAIALLSNLAIAHEKIAKTPNRWTWHHNKKVALQPNNPYEKALHATEPIHNHPVHHNPAEKRNDWHSPNKPDSWPLTSLPNGNVVPIPTHAPELPPAACQLDVTSFVTSISTVISTTYLTFWANPEHTAVAIPVPTAAPPFPHPHPHPDIPFDPAAIPAEEPVQTAPAPPAPPALPEAPAHPDTPEFPDIPEPPPHALPNSPTDALPVAAKKPEHAAHEQVHPHPPPTAPHKPLCGVHNLLDILDIGDYLLDLVEDDLLGVPDCYELCQKHKECSSYQFFPADGPESPQLPPHAAASKPKNPHGKPASSTHSLPDKLSCPRCELYSSHASPNIAAHAHATHTQGPHDIPAADTKDIHASSPSSTHDTENARLPPENHGPNGQPTFPPKQQHLWYDLACGAPHGFAQSPSEH